MGEEKKNGKEKKKKGKLLKWIIFFFFFGGTGGGVGYYLKPDLVKKYLNKAKEQVQKVTKKIKDKTQKATAKNTVTIKGHKVQVELADNPIKREEGYMNRKSIPENDGMLFVYKSEQEVSFWMKNTLIPLSIAFIKTDGTIVKIADMEVEEPKASSQEYKSYLSGEAVQYVLEVNKGWFAKNGISPGDKVEGIDKLPIKEVK